MNIDLPSYSIVETTKPKVQFETIEVTTATQLESNDDKSGFHPFTLLGFFFGSGIAIVVALLFWDN